MTLSWHRRRSRRSTPRSRSPKRRSGFAGAREAALGSAVAAPAFSVNPNSFDVTLNTNTATSQNLRVTNGGGSPLTFNALDGRERGAAGAARARPAGDAPFHHAPKASLTSCSASRRSPPAARTPFGYRWSDSNEPAPGVQLGRDLGHRHGDRARLTATTRTRVRCRSGSTSCSTARRSVVPHLHERLAVVHEHADRVNRTRR